MYSVRMLNTAVCNDNFYVLFFITNWACTTYICVYNNRYYYYICNKVCKFLIINLKFLLRILGLNESFFSYTTILWWVMHITCINITYQKCGQCELKNTNNKNKDNKAVLFFCLTRNAHIRFLFLSVALAVSFVYRMWHTFSAVTKEN